jgi:hypothetical protein
MAQPLPCGGATLGLRRPDRRTLSGRVRSQKEGAPAPLGLLHFAATRPAEPAGAGRPRAWRLAPSGKPSSWVPVAERHFPRARATRTGRSARRNVGIPRPSRRHSSRPMVGAADSRHVRGSPQPRATPSEDATAGPARASRAWPRRARCVRPVSSRRNDGARPRPYHRPVRPQQPKGRLDAPHAYRPNPLDSAVCSTARAALRRGSS